MRKIKLGNVLPASAISLGCMRLKELSEKEAYALLDTALECGIDFFDHADIYGGGKCEEIFGGYLKQNPGARERMLIQTKVGIRQGYYDFSREHILNAVDGCLQRLGTDHVDALLLHRPDALMEPEEVAEAFDQLEASGKVRHFGVSNQNPMQIELLKKYVKQKLIANQLQLSIMHTGMIDAGINVNMTAPQSFDKDGGILDYCRLHDMTIQAWSPFQYGFFEGVFLDNARFPELNALIDTIAMSRCVTNTTIAAAWILRHPAKMQVIAGTMNQKRLKEICKASTIELTREEWYEIYKAAGNKIP